MTTIVDTPQVNMHEAKTHLSRIAADIEQGRYPYYIVARHGKPVLKIVAYDGPEYEPPRRLGIAKGMFTVPDDIDFCNNEIAELFGV